MLMNLNVSIRAKFLFRRKWGLHKKLSAVLYWQVLRGDRQRWNYEINREYAKLKYKRDWILTECSTIGLIDFTKLCLAVCINPRQCKPSSCKAHIL